MRSSRSDTTISSLTFFAIRFAHRSCDLVLVGSTGWSIIETGNPQVGKAELYSLCDGEEELKLVGELASATSGKPVYERFGATTKLSDLNGDGHLDAIVCAPSWGGEVSMGDNLRSFAKLVIWTSQCTLRPIF